MTSFAQLRPSRFTRWGSGIEIFHRRPTKRSATCSSAHGTRSRRRRPEARIEETSYASQESADRHLITVLGYLLLPEIFFYGLAALVSAVLNTRGHFAAPMWTPILNNVVVILTAVVFLLLPSAGLRADTLSTAQILTLGVGTTLGIVVQAAGLLPAVPLALALGRPRPRPS